MRTGDLRVSYWAVDEKGTRTEQLASVVQRIDGGFDVVFTSDPRPVDVVLELRDGAGWREVRARRVRGGPRLLPGPYDADD